MSRGVFGDASYCGEKKADLVGSALGPEHSRDGQASNRLGNFASGGWSGDDMGKLVASGLLSRLDSAGLQAVLVAYFGFAKAREERLAEQYAVGVTEESLVSSEAESTHSVERSSVSSRRACRRARARAAARKRVSEASFSLKVESTPMQDGVAMLFREERRGAVARVLGHRASIAALVFWPAADFDADSHYGVVRAKGGFFSLNASGLGVPVFECLASVVAADVSLQTVLPLDSLGQKLRTFRFRSELLAKVPPLSAEIGCGGAPLPAKELGFCYRSLGLDCGPWPTLGHLRDSGLDMGSFRLVGTFPYVHLDDKGEPASNFSEFCVVGGRPPEFEPEDLGLERLRDVLEVTVFPVRGFSAADERELLYYVEGSRSVIDVAYVVKKGDVVGFLPWVPSQHFQPSLTVASKLLDHSGAAVYVPLRPGSVDLPDGAQCSRPSLRELAWLARSGLAVSRATRVAPYVLNVGGWLEVLLAQTQLPDALSAMVRPSQLLMGAGLSAGLSWGYAGQGLWCEGYRGVPLGKLTATEKDRMFSAVKYPSSGKVLPVNASKTYGGVAEYRDGVSREVSAYCEAVILAFIS